MDQSTHTHREKPGEYSYILLLLYDEKEDDATSSIVPHLYRYLQRQTTTDENDDNGCQMTTTTRTDMEIKRFLLFLLVHDAAHHYTDAWNLANIMMMMMK